LKPPPVKFVKNGPFGGGTRVSISGIIFLIIKLPKSNFAPGAHALTTVSASTKPMTRITVKMK
jgi:hypothetical protein